MLPTPIALSSPVSTVRGGAAEPVLAPLPATGEEQQEFLFPPPRLYYMFDKVGNVLKEFDNWIPLRREGSSYPKMFQQIICCT